MVSEEVYTSYMGEHYKSKCPCCGGEVKVEIKKAKWQGEEDRVVITHEKWQK